MVVRFFCASCAYKPPQPIALMLTALDGLALTAQEASERAGGRAPESGKVLVVQHGSADWFPGSCLSQQ